MLFLGEYGHMLHNSPQFLKPLLFLLGPLFGGSFARISNKFGGNEALNAWGIMQVSI